MVTKQKSAKRAKCNSRGWCEGMKLMLDKPSARLAPSVIFNLRTGKSLVLGIVYRETLRARGTLLNYCPWCGEPIHQNVKGTKIKVQHTDD